MALRPALSPATPGDGGGNSVAIPIFVLGIQQSGTTRMGNLLADHLRSTEPWGGISHDA